MQPWPICLRAKAEAGRCTVQALAAEIERLSARRDTLKAEIDQAKRERPARVTEATRARAFDILAECPDISGAALGRELGKSDSLGRKLKREFEAEAEPAPVGLNGNGVVR